MQTLLSRFCAEFVDHLRPLSQPLSRTAEAANAASADDPVRGLRGKLADLKQQIEALGDKVAEQQAYLLIFGPLKSGKSTLMNAISAAYVSEVSSLPAYPCMVYVQHATERRYVVTRYDGQTDAFSTADGLEPHLEKAHAALAQKIREIETKGKSFDPREHLPEAISRIDVRVPAPELSQAKAVLVDTPGLYSRMKFGYDRMTRDFRNAAACAVFVVRSDNLFLEQVFAEFTDLLGLFSKIFLVVNVDSTKFDLAKDGQLVPSLEQSDPQKVVSAFENLAMSAPLKRAAEAGKLRIYPIDLLRAASARIRGVTKDDPNAEAFGRFFGDLTEYLNSTDYLLAFLGDSLRRATTLLGEAEALCTDRRVERLRGRMRELGARRKKLDEKMHALSVLGEEPWDAHLQNLRQELAEVCRGLAKDVEEKTDRACTNAVRGWFGNDASLNQLAKGDLVPLFVRHQEDLIVAISKELSERLMQGGVGTALPGESGFTELGVDLASIGRLAHQRTDRQALVAVPPTPIRAEHLNIRPGPMDRAMFRSQNTLRRRVFGPPELPATPIKPETKTSRLGESAKSAIRRRLSSYEKEFFAETVERSIEGFARGYCEQIADAIDAALRKSTADQERELAQITLELAGCRRLLEPLDALRTQAKQARASVEKLSEHYSSMDLYMLTQPVEPDYRIPSVPPGSAQAPTSEADSGANRTSPAKAPERPAPNSKPS
ncbi:MAG: dynamin family protein [Planctomycetota bacterium]